MKAPETLLREDAEDPQSGMFKSAEHAFRFALGELGKSQQKDTLARLMPGSGSGFGALGREDRVGQAGMLLRRLDALGELRAAAIVLRLAPKAFPCACGRACCSKWRPNPDWQAALYFLTERSVTAVAGHSSQRKAREMALRNWAGEKFSMVEFARKAGVHEQTATKYCVQIGGWAGRLFKDGIARADDGMRGEQG